MHPITQSSQWFSRLGYIFHISTRLPLEDSGVEYSDDKWSHSILNRSVASVPFTLKEELSPLAMKKRFRKNDFHQLVS